MKLVNENETWKAERIFITLRDRPLALYNSMIKGFQVKGQFIQCWDYYKQLKEEGLSPDAFTFSIMLNVCSKRKDVDRALQLWEEAEKSETCTIDRILYNSLIQVFIAADTGLDRAVETLNEMKSRGIKADCVTYNTLISGFSRPQRNTTEGLVQVQMLMKQMEDEGLEPDAYTYRALIRIALRRGDVDLSIQYINEMVEKKMPVKTALYLSIIRESSKPRTVRESNEIAKMCWRIYHEIEKNNPVVPVETYDALMAFFLSKDDWKSVFGLLCIMRERETAVSRDIYIALLRGLVGAKTLEHEAAIIAEIFIEEMQTARIYVTGEMLSYLIQIFLNARQLDRANFFFGQLKENRSHMQASVYKYFLDYHSDVRYIKDWKVALQSILDLVSEMQKLSFPVTLGSYIAMIRACANSDNWEAMDGVLAAMRQDDKFPPIRSYSLILHMCARSEDRERVRSAWTYFNEMKRRGMHLNVVIYTTMIHICDLLGDLEDGMKLLEEMKGVGIYPNKHTYTSLMHLAGTVGQVEKMEELFEEYKKSDVVVNTRSYAALIHGYGVNRDIDKVLQIYNELKEKQIQIDLPVFCNLIQAAGECKRIDLIYQFFDEFSSSSQQMNHAAYMILSRALERNGDFEGAAAVLQLEKENNEKGKMTLVA